MTVAIYTRVSTDEQATQGFSIDNQHERLVAFCASQGWSDYRIYTDDGYTGTNMDRPALQRLIQHCQEGRIKTVLVYKLDRLSRKQKDCLHLLEDVFDRHKVTFKSATEPFDTSTSLGKAMLGILAVFAQLERDMIIERTTSGRRQRISKGIWPGGRIPYGYRWDKTAQRLHVIAEEAGMVREVYRLYLQGKSLSQLAEWFGDRSMARAASHAMVKRMLDMPIYAGLLPAGLAGVVLGNHDAIVTMDEWHRVQNERRRRKEGLAPPGDYLLSGLCRCGLCGSSIVHVNIHTHGNSYRYYTCKNQHVRKRERQGQPSCGVGYVREEWINTEIERQIKNAAANPEIVREAWERQHPIKDDMVTQDIERRMSDIAARIERWYDAFERGEIDSKRVRDRVQALEDERRTLTVRLEEAQPIINERSLDDVLIMLSSASELWDEMTLAERKATLRSVINRIVILSKKQYEIEWRV